MSTSYRTLNPVQNEQGKQGVGQSFGTFGELLQGVLADNHLDFLVTLPIGAYSHATFMADPESDTIQVVPPHKEKSRKLAVRVMQELGRFVGGTLTIFSDLPEGKGMASSSADMVATVRALEDYLDMCIPVEKMQKFMREIEPTDGVMYSSYVAFYHRRVELCEEIGSLPPMTIVSGDEGGEVDTIEFNKIPKPFTLEEKQEYRSLLSSITKAIQQKDLCTVGRIATRSAILNQKLRPKRYLPEFISTAERIGALGVVVAHSGTCLGILLSPYNSEHGLQVQLAQEFVQQTLGNSAIYQSLSFD